ncbi:MAG TPA: uroporphyrinogen decarboxylase family protein [Rectinemataceae bacterium]|nr:uroporphyrinogen decarboxylase family protein [Rectinemataceae bacterium]
MTDAQWELLKRVVSGKAADRDRTSEAAMAFIVDSPWLPGWGGATMLDYFSSDDRWFDINRRALEAFPEVIFVPGFWAEFGMCTEPSAFGARCSFGEREFPFAHPVLADIGEVGRLPLPDPATDGLLPFVIKRMDWALPRMEAIGHRPRFSISRGPLNVASFLLGTTDFLVALKTDAEKAHLLLRRVTDFLLSWHALQRNRFPSIDGIMILDDIVGFLGEEDFLEFGQPYLAELYSPAASVKLFHNDADCLSSVRHYAGIGINLYNPGIQRSIGEIGDLTEGRLTIMGSVPPRDVLAAGTPAAVAEAVARQIGDYRGRARLLHSCAGGMPPGVSTDNLRAFVTAVREAHSGGASPGASPDGLPGAAAGGATV